MLESDAHMFAELEDSDELVLLFSQFLFNVSDNFLAIAFTHAGDGLDVLGKDEQLVECHNICSCVHLKTMVPDEGHTYRNPQFQPPSIRLN